MALVPNSVRVEDRDWKEMYELIQIIWDTEDFLEDERTVIICPIHKKGNKLICNNYRCISLLSPARFSPPSLPSILNLLVRT
jgi:hypothetical protein